MILVHRTREWRTHTEKRDVIFAIPFCFASRSKFNKRTLTNLYNARPAWLANAHADLDAAVAAAYGWPTDLSDDEILKHILDLNLARSTGG